MLYLYIFTSPRIPYVILGDKFLIFEVVLSHTSGYEPLLIGQCQCNDHFCGSVGSWHGDRMCKALLLPSSFKCLTLFCQCQGTKV
jgi:hypothetical protein